MLIHPDLRHADLSWAIHKQWSSGHVGIVRALLCDDEVPFQCLALGREIWIGRLNRLEQLINAVNTCR